MGEKGAYLTQTAQFKPSVFDFVAQETLNDLLYLSAKKIIDLIGLRNNRLDISKWFDEYFLISHSLLQLYYLKKYGATFSEKFYGLQRVPLNGLEKKLGNKELFLSLITVALFPYVRLKLNNLAENLSFDGLTRTNRKNKLLVMKTVIHVNSGVNICYELLKFIQHLRYLSGKSDFNSPLLWAAGVKLKYTDEENELGETFTLRNFLPQLLQRSLEIGAFYIQFLQWWQNEKSNVGALPVPPPPQKSEDGIRYSDKCPICLNKRNIETVLSTSGYVFCFNCITSYLSEYNQCPVTKLPATVNSLIRVYPPS